MIFANLRGLLSRDPLRLGTILYIQGPERIVVFDLAPKVSYYREVMRSLDQAYPTPRQQVTIYEVPDATWARLKATSDQEAAAALTKLASEGQVTRHDEARVHGFRFSFARELRDGKGRDFQLSLVVYTPEVSAKRPSSGPPRLALSLDRQGEEGGRQSRRLEVEAPNPALTTLVAAKLDAGPTQTHIVVVLTPLQ